MHEVLHALTDRAAGAWGSAALTALAFTAACTWVDGYPEAKPEVGAALCLNGQDDDFNGLADCDEPRCAGYCGVVPAPPADGPDIICPSLWSAEVLLQAPPMGAPAHPWVASWCTRTTDACVTFGDELGRAKYVDATAAAGGDGSLARPFRSIGAAVSAALASGEGLVIVQAGRYAERVQVEGDVAIHGACAGVDPAVHWTTPDDSGEPMIRAASGALTLSDLILEPSAGPAVALDAATLYGSRLRVSGAAPLVTVGTDSLVDTAGLELDATGASAALTLGPGAFVRAFDAHLRAELVASVDNGALYLEDVEVAGAIEVLGPAATFVARRVFGDHVALSLAGARAEIFESAFRERSSIDVSGEGHLAIDRVALASASGVVARDDATLTVARSAWLDAAGCGLLVRVGTTVLAAAVTLTDTTFVYRAAVEPGGGTERAAALCLESGKALLDRVWIANAPEDALRMGAVSGAACGVIAHDLTILDTGGASGGTGLLVGATAVSVLERAHIIRTNGCAASWSVEGRLRGTDLFLEGNQRALCGPEPEVLWTQAVLSDNEADLETAGTSSCAPERTRGCGRPFGP